MAETERDRALDGLRGVAASIVVLYHCLLVVPALSVPADGSATSAAATADAFSWAWWIFRTPLRVLWAGPEAVLVFFVLSGFVLTLPLLGAVGWSWPRYYLRRFCRLYLPVWGALVPAVALGFAVSRSAASGSVWLRGHEPPSISSVVHDVTLLLGTSTVDGPLWSLRWEIWFSAALPLFLAVVRRVCVGRRWLVGILLLAAVSATASTVPAVGDAAAAAYLVPGLLTYLPVFGIGVVMALNLDRVRAAAARICRGRAAQESSSRTGALGCAAVVLLVCPSYLPDGASPVGHGVAACASLLGVALVLALALASAGFRRLLGARAVQWAGSRSFSIYLVHEPLIVALALSVRAAGPWPWLLVMLAAIPVVLVVSEGFHRIVECPAMRLATRSTRPARLSKLVPLPEQGPGEGVGRNPFTHSHRVRHDGM